MFISELSFQEKLEILRHGLGFGLGIEWAAQQLGGSIVWRGPQEYPNAVFSCGGRTARV